jgi:nickel-dependent lactate racemase
LADLLAAVFAEGVKKDEITILIATGMHRPSTLDEKLMMFGENTVKNFRIIDHVAEDENELKKLDGRSWSGAEVKLNKHYVDAGFRILTGLVEPHFMAGFSGGRKAICPGLASLDTVQMFHGYKFLSQPDATNGVLKNNPLHMESSSIAKLCPSDFSINVVLDQNKELNTIISGEQFISHEVTVEFVKERSFVKVDKPADVAITSCGGYPLDDTFYQCVKGIVNCLPAVKQNGEIIAFGGCGEGIGSNEYESVMKSFSTRPDDFLNDIKTGNFFKKDQWQYQMHIRAIKKVGIENLHFYTSELSLKELGLLSVTPHSVPAGEIETLIQIHINSVVGKGKTIAVFPEGPYCSPL